VTARSGGKLLFMIGNGSFIKDVTISDNEARVV
jgi:hypothetical protein